KLNKKIRLETVPLHLAKTRHRDFERLAGDIEAQLVPELEAQRILVLDRQRDQRLAILRCCPPLAFDDAIVVTEFAGPGQVLLALGKAAAAPSVESPGEVTRGDRLVVDRHQPAPNHRQHALEPGALSAQLLLEGLAL